MTKAVWFMKLFFISVSVPPIGMLAIGTFLGARSFESSLKIYKYHSMLLCKYSTLNFHIQFKVTLFKYFCQNIFYLSILTKVSTTIDLICGDRIGYKYITGTTMKNETIYQVIIFLLL